jgi:uncharacterized membrane protein YphA (DoxX/SURF4 family)
MNFIERVERWGDTHHPKWLDVLRIALGLFLFIKGIEFLNNMSSMLNMLTTKMSFGSFTVVMLSNYIAFAHLLGGGLLVLGMLTRFACLIQIPILIGAIFFIAANLSGTVMRPFSELALAILVLLLLVFFLIEGNGPWSFGRYLKEEEKKK